jgi:hypothetical protein
MKRTNINNTTPQYKGQVLVTGVYVSVEMASAVREWCIANPDKIFAVDWVHPDGTIGYLDNMIKPMTLAQIKTGLQELAAVHPSLDVGVSIMSGAVGSYNKPVIGYKIKNGKVTVDNMPHSRHKPPKRWNK